VQLALGECTKAESNRNTHLPDVALVKSYNLLFRLLNASNSCTTWPGTISSSKLCVGKWAPH